MWFLFKASSTPCEGVFLSDSAARTLFSSQGFATQVLKWSICVRWHTICHCSVSFQKTLGLNRTAHRNAFIPTVSKRTGGPLLIDDLKVVVFFCSFSTSRWSWFAFWKIYFVNLLRGKVAPWKLNPGASSGSPNSEWLKKKMQLRDTLTDALSFPAFFSVKICFCFSFLQNCVWLCIYFIHFQSRRLFE